MIADTIERPTPSKEAAKPEDARYQLNGATVTGLMNDDIVQLARVTHEQTRLVELEVAEIRAMVRPPNSAIRAEARHAQPTPTFSISRQAQRHSFEPPASAIIIPFPKRM